MIHQFLLRVTVGVMLCGLCAGCMSSPVFVGAALPIVIEVSEGKAKKDTASLETCVEAGSYQIMYANAFIESPARFLPPEKFEKRDNELARAKTRYVKGAATIERALEKKYPGICAADAAALKPYLAKLTRDDVAAVYWYVAGSLSAYSIDPFDLELGFKIPALSALIKRAYEINPDFNTSALDEFFISFYGALPTALGGDMAKAKLHFDRAVQKTNGNAASPYLSYVDVYAIPYQDAAVFKDYLDKALAVDFSKMKTPTEKLANKLAQKKARYFLKHKDRYIPEFAEGEQPYSN